MLQLTRLKRKPLEAKATDGSTNVISLGIDIDIDIYFRIVFNYVVDIFYHFTENDPRAIIGKPVFMTDLSVYFYMLM